MAYIGKQPEHGRYAQLDQINSGFNGSTTTFNATVDSVAVYPTNPQTLIISLGGVIQQPGTDFTVSAATITFTTAPAASTTFFGVLLGDVLDIGTPSDDSVTATKISSNAVITAKIIDDAVTYTKMQNISTGNRVLGATSNGAAITETQVITAMIADNAVTGTKIAVGSDAQGDILYYDGTNYVRLAKGTADQVLTMNDGATAPGWETASSGGAALTGSTNNTITTVTGANAIQGEANLTFDGANLYLINSATSSSSNIMAYSSATSTATPARLILRVGSGNTGDAFVTFQDQGGAEWAFGLDNSDSDKIKLGYGGTVDSNTRLTIQTDGLVGIGTTSPSKKLHIVGDGFLYENLSDSADEDSASFLVAVKNYSDEFGSIRFEDRRGTQAQPSFIFAAEDGSGGTACFLIKTGTTSTRFQLNQNGDITGTHGSYHTSSDSRAKENIVNSTVGLDAVMQMRPVKFNFIADRGVGTNTRVGFIAQEVEALIPEAVFTADTPNDPIPNIKSIEDPQLIPVLVKAIQELNAKVDALGS